MIKQLVFINYLIGMFFIFVSCNKRLNLDHIYSTNIQEPQNISFKNESNAYRISKRKLSSDHCNNMNNCEEIFNCYKNYLDTLYLGNTQNNIPYYGGTIDDKISYEQLLECALKLSQNKSLEAHHALVQHHKNKYDYYILIGLTPTKNDILSELRGKDAFELALQYFKHSMCNSSACEDVICTQTGIELYEDVLLKMIKRIANKATEKYYIVTYTNYYATHNNAENDYCNENFYKHLVKTIFEEYENGKIILKEYGEN